MIETVDQLRIKSDSNTQMLCAHIKNLAKLTAFLATMSFFGAARCPALCPLISTDGCRHGCMLCKNTFTFLVHNYFLFLNYYYLKKIFNLYLIIDFITQYANTLIGYIHLF